MSSERRRACARCQIQPWLWWVRKPAWSTTVWLCSSFLERTAGSFLVPQSFCRKCSLFALSGAVAFLLRFEFSPAASGRGVPRHSTSGVDRRQRHGVSLPAAGSGGLALCLNSGHRAFSSGERLGVDPRAALHRLPRPRGLPASRSMCWTFSSAVWRPQVRV